MTVRPAVETDRRALLSLAAALAVSTSLPAPARAAALGGGGRETAAGGDPPFGGLPTTLAPDASTRFRAVAERLVEAMSRFRVPGAALGILADGREEHATFGYADLAGATPVTQQTLFQTGSLTKTFTGTAALRLAEQGRLGLEAPVREYVPDLTLADASVAREVTVGQLLTHTGGWWGDYFTDTGAGPDAIEAYVRTVLPTLPQIVPLGRYFSYNNAGFTLLGQVLERATGRPYGGAVADAVLAPLGMARSTFEPEAVRREPYASGYALGREGLAPVSPLFFPRSVDPAGGLWSTTRELLRYARFHIGDGTAPPGAGGAGGQRLLSEATLRRMQTPQLRIPGQAALQMGLSWFVIEAPGVRLLYHPGDTLGQHTEFWVAPDAGVAVAVLTNGQPGGGLAGAAAFAEARRQFLGVSAEGLAPGGGGAGGGPSPMPISPEALAEYAGRYAVPAVSYTFRPEGEELVLTVEPTPLPGQIQADVTPELPPELRARIVAPDLAVLSVEGVSLPVPFVRRPDGSVGWLSLGLRLFPRVAGATE